MHLWDAKDLAFHISRGGDVNICAMFIMFMYLQHHRDISSHLSLYCTLIFLTKLVHISGQTVVISYTQ